jgi:hypothetical protein
MSQKEKKKLLQKWLYVHAPNNTAPLLLKDSMVYELSREAEKLLEKHQGLSSDSLYVMCLGNPMEEGIPAYIGKSSSPMKRWKKGHLKKLNKVRKGKSTGSYVKWVELLDRVGIIPFILCIKEDDVRFPPIPGFPATVGSIEYQLISLAADSFSEYLLNQEGAPR